MQRDFVPSVDTVEVIQPLVIINCSLLVECLHLCLTGSCLIFLIEYTLLSKLQGVEFQF